MARKHVIDPRLASLKVFAFVGPAGTGKSQRAQLVADYLDAEYIIDDGLVIRRGSIKCGKSAKTERNQVRAIRRALFEYEDHRKAVMDFFASVAPCSLVLLSTSEDMVDRIVCKLQIPKPVRILRIEEVSTPEEIARARKERYTKGQHVIPVSHVLVRKNFAGKMVGRLRVLWKSKSPYEGEKTIVRPPFSFYGEVHVEPEAIEQLVSHIAIKTSQVGKIVQIRIKTEPRESISVDMDIGIETGPKNLVAVAQQVKERVGSSVRYFTGLDVRNVSVTIVEVIVK